MGNFVVALKLLLVVAKWTDHHGLAPLYITELVSTVAAQTSRPGLRSADTTNYVQPRTRTKFAERAFSYAGPELGTRLFTSNTNDKQFQTQAQDLPFHLCF